MNFVTLEQLLYLALMYFFNVFPLYGLEVHSKAAHRVIKTETESQHIYGP